MAQQILKSPIGPILLRADGDRLDMIQIDGDAGEIGEECAVLTETAAQLSAWFAGKLTRFDLPLAAPATLRGAAHREAIAAIPYGETMSYGALARMIGSSPRAIGQACRRNPFPIVVPCHRVIAAGGAIGYYSGGKGITTKLWLLELEHRLLARKE